MTTDSDVSKPDPRKPEQISIVSTIVPYDKDDARSLYFGYRSSGYSVREALRTIDRGKSWLSTCRLDPEFVKLEVRIPEFRRELSKEYVELEFFRNFRMVMEKDYQVLRKSLSKDPADILTKQESEYLLKLRTQYNPAQIQILEAIVKGEKGGFNFAQFVAEHPDIVQLSRTDTITMSKTNRIADED